MFPVSGCLTGDQQASFSVDDSGTLRCKSKAAADGRHTHTNTSLLSPPRFTAGTPVRLGATQFGLPEHTLRKGLSPPQLIISPNGVAFAPPAVRPGVLPRMLREILETRVMVKGAMKRNPASNKVRGTHTQTPYLGNQYVCHHGTLRSCYHHLFHSEGGGVARSRCAVKSRSQGSSTSAG